MSKEDYLVLIDWIKRHNINEIPYDLFIQFEIAKINYNKLFQKLNIPINFSLYQVDDFINDNVIIEKYKENIIFQYIYLILSPPIYLIPKLH